jgi:hypothetical protein
MSEFNFINLVEVVLALVMDLLQVDAQIATALLPW